MSLHNRDAEMDVEEEGDMVLFDQANLLTNRIKCKNNDLHGGFKLRLLKTLALCAAFLGLGLCFAVLGPTLLDLRCHVATDISHISYVFTGRSLGYLLGSIIGGFLFDKFNQLLLLSFALFLTSVATGLAPWSSQLMVLATAIGVQGLTMGFLDTGGNVLCLTLWGKKSGPFMQALHFAFGIGAFISPLIAQPFLAAQEICPNNSLEFSYVGKMLYPGDTLTPSNMTGINKPDVSFTNPDYFIRKEREAKLEGNYINKDSHNSSFLDIFELDNSDFSELNKTETVSNKTEVTNLDAQLNETKVSNFSVMQPNKTEVNNSSDIQSNKTNSVNVSNSEVSTTPKSSSVPSLTNTTTIKPKKPKPGTDGKFLPPEDGRGPIWTHKEVPSNKVPKPGSPPPVPTSIPTDSSSLSLSNYSSVSNNETFVPQNETFNSTSGNLFDNSTSSNLNTSSVSKNVDSNLTAVLNDTTMNHEIIKNSPISLQNSSILEPISEQVDKNKGDSEANLYSTTISAPTSTSIPSIISLKNNAASDNTSTKGSILTTTVSSFNIELPPTFTTNNFPSTPINEKTSEILNSIEINKINSKHTTSSVVPSSSTEASTKFHKTHSSRHKTTSKKKLPNSNEIQISTPTIPPVISNNLDSIYKTPSPIDPVTPASSHNGVIINDSNVHEVPFSHPTSINISSSKSTSDLPTPLSNFSTVVSSISASTPLTILNPINSTVVSLVITSTPLTNIDPISNTFASPVITLKPFVNSDSISSTIVSSTSKTITPYGVINSSSNVANEFLIISRIQFAYLIIAVFIFQTSIAFLVFFGIGSHNLRAIMPVDSQTHDDHYSRSALRFQVLGLLFIFYFMYVGMEATYGGLLMTFSVCSKLHLTNSFGAYITSLFWGMFALARGFAIYFAKWFSPAAMLRTNLFLCIIASVILVFFAETYSWILWFGSGLLGVGMASIFPTGITWVEQYIDMSNKEASILVVGSALGEMLLPVLAGHFFKTFNPMFLMYLILSLCMLCLIVYIVMERVADSFGDKYGFLLLNMQTVGSSQTESMEDKMENEALVDSDTVPMLNGSSKTKSVRFSPSSENRTKSTKNE